LKSKENNVNHPSLTEGAWPLKQGIRVSGRLTSGHDGEHDAVVNVRDLKLLERFKTFLIEDRLLPTLTDRVFAA